MSDRITKIFVGLAGVGALGFAALTIVKPEAFSDYGLAVNTPQARIVIRSLIGGFELALAGLMLLGGKLGLSLQQRAGLFSVTLLTLGSVRILAATYEGLDVLFHQPLSEGALEIIVGLIAAALARRA